MSAFLGPIHFWLYNKIQLQEELIRDIVAGARENQWKEIQEMELGERSVREELRPLNELIDTMNIHGWLQERIHDAEGRYAVLVTSLLRADRSRLSVLEEIARRFGQRHSVGASADAQDCYKAFNDSLLSGMPCDRVNVLTEQEDDRYSWEQASEIHEEYWKAADGDVKIYYDLREKIMEGMLEGSAYSITSPDRDHYTVQKKG